MIVTLFLSSATPGGWVLNVNKLAGMTTLLVAALLADPLLLEIGEPGIVEVGMGYTSLSTGRSVSLEEIAKAAEPYQFVMVGESHDQLAHHKAQAEVVQALVDAGREVSVGFEMFHFTEQDRLQEFPLGFQSVPEFIIASGWNEQWGMSFELYQPIFEVIRENRLPIVALNVPRTWVRTVSREGLDALSPAQKRFLGKVDTSQANHRAVFDSLVGGTHGMEASAMDPIYAAQCVWDVAMAHNAYGFVAKQDSNAVMVVVAGIGHMMYGQGINLRLKLLHNQDSLNIACISANEPREVSKGLAHYAYVSPPEGAEVRD